MELSLNALTLNELRAKTDRQLATLIGRRLERGLASARSLVETGGRRSNASEQYARVLQAETEARTWIPFLSSGERRRLQAKLDELTDLLHAVQEPQHRVHAACS